MNVCICFLLSLMWLALSKNTSQLFELKLWEEVERGRRMKVDQYGWAKDNAFKVAGIFKICLCYIKHILSSLMKTRLH